jgi:hypothetical protein
MSQFVFADLHAQASVLPGSKEQQQGWASPMPWLWTWCLTLSMANCVHCWQRSSCLFSGKPTPVLGKSEKCQFTDQEESEAEDVYHSHRNVVWPAHCCMLERTGASITKRQLSSHHLSLMLGMSLRTELWPRSATCGWLRVSQTST